MSNPAGGSSAFIMMPFAPEFDDVHAAIRAAVVAVDAQISAVRLDDIRAAGFITDDMIDQLQRATVCIADVTGANPNVMWEVGFAAALKKPMIAILEEGARLPFDVKDVRSITYSRADLAATLSGPLRDAISATLERYSAAASWVPRVPDAVSGAGRVVAVTGSMDVDVERARPRVLQLLRPHLGRGHGWLVGSAGVIDELVVDYLLAHGEDRISVVGYGPYDISGVMLDRLEAHPGMRFVDGANEQMPMIPGAPSDRDVLFLSRADLVIVMWNGISAGTRDLADWLREQRKDHVLAFVASRGR